MHAIMYNIIFEHNLAILANKQTDWEIVGNFKNSN